MTTIQQKIGALFLFCKDIFAHKFNIYQKYDDPVLSFFPKINIYMKNLLIAGIVSVFVLMGCTKRETTYDVSWYKAHETERNTKIDECNKNPGEKESTPNCINAHRADNELRYASRGYPNPMQNQKGPTDAPAK